MARLIYTKHYLLPFIRENTVDQCIRILSDPPSDIVEATKEFVKKMASGGRLTCHSV